MYVHECMLKNYYATALVHHVPVHADVASLNRHQPPPLQTDGISGAQPSQMLTRAPRPYAPAATCTQADTQMPCPTSYTALPLRTFSSIISSTTCVRACVMCPVMCVCARPCVCVRACVLVPAKDLEHSHCKATKAATDSHGATVSAPPRHRHCRGSPPGCTHAHACMRALSPHTHACAHLRTAAPAPRAPARAQRPPGRRPPRPR